MNLSVLFSMRTHFLLIHFFLEFDARSSSRALCALCCGLCECQSYPRSFVRGRAFALYLRYASRISNDSLPMVGTLFFPSFLSTGTPQNSCAEQVSSRPSPRDVKLESNVSTALVPFLLVLLSCLGFSKGVSFWVVAKEAGVSRDFQMDTSRE